MASFRKHNRGWRAEVAKLGIRKSKILPTKQAAKDWAARVEYEISNSSVIAAKELLGDVMARYEREVSSGKRGHRWESIRIEKFRKDSIAQIQIGSLTATDLADWRDRRLRDVSPESVRREINLLSAILTQARKEWRLIDHNPMADVKKPPAQRPRDRLPSDDEIDRLRLAAGEDLSKSTARAFHAFLFACETAMRAGEIVGMTWDRVDLDKRTVHLPLTKNGSSRDVPLSSEAVALLEQLPDRSEDGSVFRLSSSQLDALWRKVRDRALAEGLRFHDSRAAALTKLSRRVDVMTLAKISGHRDLRILLNTYYRETAEDIAKRLG